MRCVLVGNYGVGNFGDDALMETFLSFGKGTISWTTVMARPQQASHLPRLPGGIRSFLHLRWIKTVMAIARADCMIFGGGTLFTDTESIRACFLWGAYAALAKLCRTPYILASQGIGPFRSRTARCIARWTVRHAAYVSVRDAQSFERVNKWHSNAVQTADPVLRHFCSTALPKQTQNLLVLIPRHNSTQIFDEAAMEISVSRRFSSVAICLFQPDDLREQQVAKRLSVQFPGANLVEVRDLQTLMEILSRAEYCVTERFHGALAAIAAGIPTQTVSQADGDKLSQAMALQESHAVLEEAVRRIQKEEESLLQALQHCVSRSRGIPWTHMLMRTLYLREEEQQAFGALSSNLREGWEIVAEQGTYQDTALKRHARIALMRLHGEDLLALQRQMREAATMEEVQTALSSVEFSSLSDEDLSQLLFAAGPDVVSGMIVQLLPTVGTDEDIERIAALSLVRHEIYEAFASIPHSA